MTLPPGAIDATQYVVPLPVQRRSDGSSGPEAISRSLGARAFTQWRFVADPARARAQTGILVCEQAAPWDMALAAEVSRRTGGFVLVSQSGGPSGAGTAVLYSGRLLRAWRRDAVGHVVLRAGVADQGNVPDDAESDAAALLHVVTGRTPGALHPSNAQMTGATPAGSSAASPRVASEAPPILADFSQLVLDCDPNRWREVLESPRTFRRLTHSARDDLADGWRWRLDRTPEAGVPFVMVRGPAPLPAEWVTGLARRVGGFAAAAEVRGQKHGEPRPVPWVWVALGEEPQLSHSDDGVDAVEVWRDIAVVIGSHAAALAWPATDPGQPFPVSGQSTSTSSA